MRGRSVPRVSLVGVSHGTRVAPEYQRQFPTRCGAAVLDGVVRRTWLPASVGVDNATALQAFAACEAASAARATRRHCGNLATLLFAAGTGRDGAEPGDRPHETLHADARLRCWPPGALRCMR